MRYLIHKDGRLHSKIEVKDFKFDNNKFSLINTVKIPTFLVSKWKNANWIDITTAEDMLRVQKEYESAEMSKWEVKEW